MRAAPEEDGESFSRGVLPEGSQMARFRQNRTVGPNSQTFSYLWGGGSHKMGSATPTRALDMGARAHDEVGDPDSGSRDRS